MGKKDDIRDVLLPAIEKWRSPNSALWCLEPAALARRVIKGSKYIRSLVDSLLNSDIKQLENLCIKNFPAPAATNGGSETAPAASTAKPKAAASQAKPKAAASQAKPKAAASQAKPNATKYVPSARIP
jgi:hypothetical protein